MKKNLKNLVLIAYTLVACTSNDDATVVEELVVAGSANFNKYVALGDSYSAGYSDGALFIEGQKVAYPNLLSQQFSAAGGGVFTTPFMADNVGGLLLAGNEIEPKRMFYNGFNPVSVSELTSTEVSNKISGPFNNFGIPGAKSYHLVATGYGELEGIAKGIANPYFVRFSSSASTTVIADALAQSPTFFSLWIGGNDVLGYATSGGIGKNQTGNNNPFTYGSNDITDPTVFASVFNNLISTMTTNGAKGVVANLPYINTLPYFTTVPYNPLNTSVIGSGNIILGQTTISELNSLFYGPLKQVLTILGAGDRINLLSNTDSNPLLIKDESLPNLSNQLTEAFTTYFTPSMGATLAAQTGAVYGSIYGQARQATSKDLVLLTTKPLIGLAPNSSNSGLGMAPPSPFKFGITFPLQDEHVLIPSEINEIKVATDAYNSTIKTIADAKGLAFVDAKTIMTQLSSTGIVSNGITVTSTYITGGFFSLDGIHPNPRGYALISNAFIDAINAKYSSSLKKVDIGKYKILYPSSL